MAETLFEELKRYVAFGDEDAAALRALHPHVSPFFTLVSEVFYQRILEHAEARTALVGGESQIGHLKITLVAWMERLFAGPWDEQYFEARCRIGRVHVRIALPQHYMFGAMNVTRQELDKILDTLPFEPQRLRSARAALGKILDLELAIMLHTYREDLLAQQGRVERLSTFGQLVGSIGHELRNPLAVIETSLFVLRGRVNEDERVHKHVERIGEQVAIANGIVTALLDMIRDRPLTATTVSLAEIAQEAASVVSRPPGVALSMEGLAELPVVEGDPTQLRQVLINLIENAVHAASPLGTVSITGASTDRFSEVAVADSGPGVDPSIRSRLFEPLMTTKAKGIGLGLALVKRIVERHGGTIQYTSENGTRFVVSLPRKP